jgi:uncharacterized protein YjiS (DUF1127 family)
MYRATRLAVRNAQFALPLPGGRTTRVTSAQDFFIRFFDLLAAWQDRAVERRRLAGLDDRMLRDIGLDRAAAMNEVAKPFWRS